MNDRPDPASEATAAQIRASRPDASTWVAANAGSGKTSVLTRRVARLLLDRCPPEKILCLTYTRAAAAEMQTRLFEMLGEWSLQDDDRLRATLRDLGVPEAPDAEALAEARRLFAKALETPGGLKIQTIHAFCAALLRRFPLEAGAPPDFAELDDRTRIRIIEDLRDRMAEAAEQGGSPAFDAAAARLSHQGLEALTNAIFQNRAWFPEEGAEAALRAAYDIPEGADLAAEAARELSQTTPADLDALTAALRAGKPSDVKYAGLVAAVADNLRAGEPLAAARAIESAGLTQKGEPRSTRSLPTKAVREAAPWTAEAVEWIIEQAVELRRLRVAHEGFAKSLDLHRYASALLTLYAAEKTRRGAIDFDDLVRIAARLLTEADMAGWVLFKLDGGLDHILIDEAQDTSPEQWRLIRALAEEFFAGEGARDASRTVFAVGDEKQSIYSFQGAEPREFGRMRAHFRDRLAEAEGLQETSLDFSFRSAPAILEVVDRVFEATPEGLSSEAAPPAHRPFNPTAPGLVELWPLLDWPEEPGEEPPWHAPVDQPAPTAPRARLAAALGRHVAMLVQEGAPIPDRHAPGGWRPLRPGDVMILLRRRREMASALIAALKANGVPVAGADRLRLDDSLAVRDLLSLLRVGLDREDDLSVAEVLRSPLGLVSEDTLYDLAHDRRRPLIDRVLAARDAHPEAAALLQAVTDRADYDRPYELLELALTAHGGRARIRARMSPEEEDAVDELLAQALAYERAETPTLAGFLAWMEAAEDLELKREMGGAGDAVRVMTVHGAKGLEAPYVILPDAGPSGGARGDEVLRLPEDDPDAAPLALWSAPDDQAAEPVRAAKEAAKRRQEEESRRLLYVALTRARSRLLICGAHLKKGEPDGSWHSLVGAGLQAAGAAPAEPPETLAPEDRQRPGLRLARGWTPPAGPSPDALAAAAPPLPAALPADRLPRGPEPPRRVNASALGAEDAAHAAPSAWDRETARRRGNAIHMLLEELPGVPEPERADAAARWLAAARPPLPEPLRQGCVEEALAALAHPDAVSFLAPEAIAEAGLTALLPSGLRMTGRVDRLLVTPDRVRVLDWKTGPAAASPDDAPESYLRQMAAYREALRALHPGKPVETALFWTAAGRLDRLSDAALDAALARLAAEPAPPPGA
ncbi:MAG: double-strand break repair helicase AddA [Pseudomonadota bacterium]